MKWIDKKRAAYAVPVHSNWVRIRRTKDEWLRNQLAFSAIVLPIRAGSKANTQGLLA